MKRDKAEACIALATRTVAVAWTEDRRIYSVPSQSTPESHLVEFWPATNALRCDCAAASFGRSCVHAASVLLARSWWRLAARRQPLQVKGTCKQKRRLARAA
jgi:hypothetical protein